MPLRVDTPVRRYVDTHRVRVAFGRKIPQDILCNRNLDVWCLCNSPISTVRFCKSQMPKADSNAASFVSIP